MICYHSHIFPINGASIHPVCCTHAKEHSVVEMTAEFMHVRQLVDRTASQVRFQVLACDGCRNARRIPLKMHAMVGLASVVSHVSLLNSGFTVPKIWTWIKPDKLSTRILPLCPAQTVVILTTLCFVREYSRYQAPGRRYRLLRPRDSTSNALIQCSKVTRTCTIFCSVEVSD